MAYTADMAVELRRELAVARFENERLRREVSLLADEFASRHKYVGSLIGGRRGDMNAREANTWLVAESDLRALLGSEATR